LFSFRWSDNLDGTSPVRQKDKVKENSLIDNTARLATSRYIYKSMPVDIFNMKKIDCSICGGCCKHIATEIDKPEDEEDFDYIIWYLMHENVHISISNDDEWLLEFITPCKALGKDNRCTAYEKRPDICRGYESDECVTNGEGSPDKALFKSREDLLRWMKKKEIKYKHYDE